MTVRVRFPPSPTGVLHVGSGRTVLYNWLFARHHGGVLVFRVDDTDLERSREEFLEDIVEGLRWLGIDWDEGIEVGGPHGPYRQSQRLSRYQEVAARLVASGWAYYDFSSPEDLEALRAEAAAEGRSPVYDGRFRLPATEAAGRVAAGEQARDGEEAAVTSLAPAPAGTASARSVARRSRTSLVNAAWIRSARIAVQR